MEKKKKGKGIVIAIIILALVVGGYFVYDSYFSDTAEETTIVEEKKVASIDLAENEVSAYEMTDKTNHKIFSSLQKNEATCFKLEKNNSNVISISQINEDNFNKISPTTFGKTRKLLSKGISTFLNMHYDKLPIGIYDPTNSAYSTIFGNLFFDGGEADALKWVKKAFGEELEKMFTEYKLILSCENISVKKIAVYDTGEKYYGSVTGVGDVVGEHFRYYCVIDTEVKTKSAEGKISELGVFADEGKSKKLEFLMVCDMDKMFKELNISRIYFD